MPLPVVIACAARVREVQLNCAALKKVILRQNAFNGLSPASPFGADFSPMSCTLSRTAACSGRSARQCKQRRQFVLRKALCCSEL